MSTPVPELPSRTENVRVVAASGSTPAALALVEGSTQAALDEVLLALNELLEAERAGARVAMETARDIPPSALAALVQDVHKDEVHWCGMLMRTIKAMGTTPSSATGAFWGKAMAIPDLEQRLLFLNRGQAWVVRKLEALIPRFHDPRIRDDLQAMLTAHRANIERVDARARDQQGAPPPGPR